MVGRTAGTAGLPTGLLNFLQALLFCRLTHTVAGTAIGWRAGEKGCAYMEPSLEPISCVVEAGHELSSDDIAWEMWLGESGWMCVYQPSQQAKPLPLL